MNPETISNYTSSTLINLKSKYMNINDDEKSHVMKINNYICRLQNIGHFVWTSMF